LTAAFFFFWLGNTIDSAVGSNDLRFGALLAGNKVASAFASACVGFFTLEIILSAAFPNGFSCFKQM